MIKRSLFFNALLLAGCAFPFYAFATTNTETWTGGGTNNNWTTPQNWKPVFTPQNTDNIIFNGGLQNPINVNMNFVSFTPSSLSFTNGATCQLSGSGILTVGALANCPNLTCSTSFAEWQSGTALNLNGSLELTGGLSGTFQFADLTGSGNLRVDSGITCNLTGANTTWTASSVTIAGILNVNASNALPTGATISLQTLSGVQLNLGNSVSNTVQNLAGGKGSSINLNANSTLTFQNASGSYGGLITSNGGTLQIGGSSIYTLTGLSGGFPQNLNMNVQSGTLKAGVSGSLPNGTYTISNPATLDLNGFQTSITSINGDGTINLSSSSSGGLLELNGYSAFSGTIQNGGAQPGLIRNDGFTLTLSGNNTYSGGTIIGSAGLQIYDVSNLGSPTNSTYLLSIEGVASIKALANLDLAPSSGLGIFIQKAAHVAVFDVSDFPITISCPISGYGGISINGLNGLTLAAPGSYLGGTTINQATLTLVDGGSLPTAGIVNVVSGGLLDISQLTSPVTSMIGSLAGDGDVSLGGNTLEVNSSTNSIFSGTLSDSGNGGGLIKSGTATLSLTGANNYLGPTQINGGTLVIGVGGVGSLTNSAVTVNSGGTLQGTGTISGNVSVESGGTISGGNSIGTISMGSLILNPGANLTLEINNTGASTIYDITTTATLAGNLAVTVDRGNYEAGTTYTFISTGASGRAGTFDTVTSNTFGTTTLTGRLDYGSDFVQLVLFSPIYAIIPLNGLTGNAEALAEYLNSLRAYPEVQPALLAIGALPTDEAQKALDSISPARNAISSWTAQNTLFGINHVAVNRMLQQRYMRWIETHPPIEAVLDLKNELRDLEDHLLASQTLAGQQKKQPLGKAQTAAKEESGYAVWAEGLGLFAHQNAIHENPSYHSSTGCGLVGADFYNFTNGQMGAALGYAQSSIQESSTGDGSIQYYLAGLYGTGYIDDGYIELGLWGSFDQFQNKRNIVYPGFSASATSNHNGWQLVPHIGGGYDFNFCWGAIEPFATFDAAALFQQGYSEHGAGVLDMHVKSSTSWLLRSEAGLNAYQVIQWTSSYFIFRETLSYVNLTPYGIGKLANVELVGFPPGFTVTSFTDVQNMIAPGFEFFFRSDQGFFFSLSYEGEFTIGPGNYMSNEAIGKIGYFF